MHYSSRFRRQYKKLSKSLHLKTKARVALFLQNEFDPALNNHLLHGVYAGCRSINITGDFRLIYEKYPDGSLNFIAIGTHAELYE